MSDSKKSPLADLNLTTIILFLRRRTYLTVAIVSGAVMVLLTVLVVLPQINLIIAHNQNLNTEEKKLADLQTRSAFLRSLNVATLSDEQKVFENVLPGEKPVTPLISSIERLANDAGVSLLSYELSPGRVATAGAQTAPETVVVKSLVEGVGALPLKMDVQGGFVQMNTFFKSLDLLIPLVNVKTINFTVLSQTKSGPVENIQYKASVELDALYALPTTGRPSASPILTAFTSAQQRLIASVSAMVASQPQIVEGSFVAIPATGGATLRPSVFSY